MSWLDNYISIMREADRRREDALKVLQSNLKPGTDVRWDHHGHYQHGTVEWVSRYSFSDHRIGVRNSRTGKSVRICPSQILGPKL